MFAGALPLPCVMPAANASLSFWDDCKAVFQMPAGDGIGSRDAVPPIQDTPLSTHATLSVAPLPRVQAHAINLRTGETQVIDANVAETLPPGQYEVTLRESNVPMFRTLTTRRPGAAIELGAEALDPARASIVDAIGGLNPDGAVVFSKTVGPMANRDLGLWLTIMGAARIVAAPRSFPEMSLLQPADIQVFHQNTTGVYFVGAMDA